VPITFTLKPPEINRDNGIPNLQQGLAPAYPSEFKSKAATVTAQVALDAEGNVADALVTSGEAPWSELVLKALRTWKFPAGERGATLAFKLEARFVPATATAPPRVELRLSDPRHNTAPVQAAGTPEPAPPPPAATATPQTATEGQAPAGPPPKVVPPTLEPPPAAAADATSHAAAPAAPPPSPPAPGPQPAIEMVPEPPARPVDPGVPENGVSSIRDIMLAQGIPDLVKGRRPVPPPLARINGVTGSVEVHFAVSPGGTTSIQSLEGPDLLKPAAQDAVNSWSFRRTSAQRLHLVAVFDYHADSATANVSVEAQPAH
jgi:hypothetical protein